MINYLAMIGWIALDIDGTITNDKYSVPDPVINYLQDAQEKGWKILLTTGRAASFASLALKKMNFPFLLAAQNGSIALEMPAKKILFQSNMKARVIDELEKVYRGKKSDFLVYSGFEKGDFCYFRPKFLNEENLAYVLAICEREKKEGMSVDEFPRDIEIPLIKCFGRIDFMQTLGRELIQSNLFSLALIRDPFHPSNHILMVTDCEASKGEALKKLISLLGRGECVIGAGNDENDMSLLQVADVKIAMPKSPEILRIVADFIAPPVSENGIIDALKIAMKKCG